MPKLAFHQINLMIFQLMMIGVYESKRVK